MVEEKKPAAPHNIIMEGRRKMTVTGVTEIDSFDEQSLEGERIDGLSYADNLPVRGGILGRLFR